MGTTRDEATAALETRFAGDSVSHLWSDALFARLRAREADRRVNEAAARAQGLAGAIQGVRRSQGLWERGSYVRWTVTTGWSVMEQLFCDQLGTRSLHGIPGILVQKMTANGLTPIDPTSALWKRIDDLRAQRNNFTHNSLPFQERMAPLVLAEQAIHDYRDAVLDFFAHIPKDAPIWIRSDSVPGDVPGAIAVMTVSSANLGSAGDPLRIITLFGGQEFGQQELRGDEDPYPHVRQIIEGSIVPLDTVRIYRGNSLEDELVLKGRGTK